jgi:hypothetical protein
MIYLWHESNKLHSFIHGDMLDRDSSQYQKLPYTKQFMDIEKQDIQIKCPYKFDSIIIL